jgi:hypothetical protein
VVGLSVGLRVVGDTEGTCPQPSRQINAYVKPGLRLTPTSEGVRTIVGAVGAIVGRKVGLSVSPARRLTDVGLPDTT